VLEVTAKPTSVDARGRNPSRKLPKVTLEQAQHALRTYVPDVEIFEQLQAERDDIRKARENADAAESAFLQQVAERYIRRELSQRDLARIYHGLRAFGRTGMATRWDAVVPFKRLLIEHQQFNEPHTDGRWYGAWPVQLGDSLPIAGQAVVYYLFDEEDVCCYIGSSGDLRTRLKSHRATGKVFLTWVAEPHPTRSAAYEAEEAILQGMTELPQYNKSIYR
jgi:hypothetical protein